MTQPAYFLVWTLISLLLIEAGVLFSVIRYYRKKVKDQQERFAGYLKSLDDENARLKRKIANSSNKKSRPQQPREFEL